MPIVHVRALPPGDGTAVERVLGALAQEVSEVCECALRDVWCTFSALDAMTIGTTVMGGAGQIAYVDVLMRPRGGTIGRRALEAAARVVSDHLRIPLEDVWARMDDLRSGQVFSGGNVVEW